MSEAENLRIIAEVGIALAGFSGVIVALGHRSEGPWDFGRLWLLLTQSLGAVLLAFVPLLLDAAALDATTNWRVSSGVMSLFGFGLVVRIARTQRYSPDFRRVVWGVFIGSWSAAATLYALLAIHALGGLAGIGAFLYFLGLVWLIAMASLNFILLLLAKPSRS